MGAPPATALLQGKENKAVKARNRLRRRHHEKREEKTRRRLRRKRRKKKQKKMKEQVVSLAYVRWGGFLIKRQG